METGALVHFVCATLSINQRSKHGRQVFPVYLRIIFLVVLILK